MNRTIEPSGVERAGVESPLARPIDLSASWNASVTVIEGTERWVRTMAAIDLIAAPHLVAGTTCQEGTQSIISSRGTR